MAGQTMEANEAQVEQVPADPWALAFAALDKEEQAAPEAAPDTGQPDGGNVPDTDQADQGEGSPAPEAGDGTGAEDLPGGPGDLGGANSGEDEDLGVFDLDLSEEQVKGYEDKLIKEIQERTITDVAAAYIKKGARNVNGRLGATIDDPDICKRDRDGVPRFYNPETGREFTGDNPRRQAQEWVDDYNRDLANKFNDTCRGYSQRLLEQEQGRLAVIKFAPKYKALDPVRRSMLKSIIEDYEVTDDNGDVVSYSCDLDKTLAAVNRQVRIIQQRFGQQAKPAAPAAPSGPVLDTPSIGGGGTQGGERPQFKSIAEAMEWEQDRLLEKMRNKGRK